MRPVDSLLGFEVEHGWRVSRIWLSVFDPVQRLRGHHRLACGIEYWLGLGDRLTTFVDGEGVKRLRAAIFDFELPSVNTSREALGRNKVINRDGLIRVKRVGDSAVVVGPSPEMFCIRSVPAARVKLRSVIVFSLVVLLNVSANQPCFPLSPCLPPPPSILL